MLTVLDHIPSGLLSLEATQLHQLLPGPSLIHLSGKRTPPLFISVLMHGNEDTGWLAVRSLLQGYQGRELPRAASIFIGNVAAAQFSVRRLDDQPDYNRIWCGEGTPEHAMMREVVQQMQQRGVFLSVDIHNNTGMNPHYACINRIDNRFLQLAVLFSRTVVYFIRPQGVQSAAFAALCPAVTLECGRPGQARGVEHARDYLEACVNLLEIPDHPLAHGDVDLFHTVAVVKIPGSISFGYGNAAASIRLVEDLDRMNFSELPANTLFGWIDADVASRLDVQNEQGVDVGADYFTYQQNEIRTRVPVMPSMLSCDAEVVRQDCLCYLMERFHRV